MAPAGAVGGLEASKMSPFCGRPGGWKVGVFPRLGASHYVEKRSRGTLGPFGGVSW